MDRNYHPRRTVTGTPTDAGRGAIDSFVALGWGVARRSLSHIILTRPGHIATLSIPDHTAVAKGKPRALLRSAQVSVADFVRAYDSR